MRVGYFDGNPTFKSLDKKDIIICTREHIELATEAAKGINNANETLRLNSAKFKTLAVVGPHANATTKVMIGKYAGIENAKNVSKLLRVLQNKCVT